MNNSFWNELKDNLSNYQPAVDTDKLWKDLERKKRKRRLVFFIWGGSICAIAMFLTAVLIFQKETNITTHKTAELTVKPITATNKENSRVNKAAINKENTTTLIKKTFATNKGDDSTLRSNAIISEFYDARVNRTIIPLPQSVDQLIYSYSVLDYNFNRSKRVINTVLPYQVEPIGANNYMLSIPEILIVKPDLVSNKNIKSGSKNRSRYTYIFGFTPITINRSILNPDLKSWFEDYEKSNSDYLSISHQVQYSHHFGSGIFLKMNAGFMSICNRFQYTDRSSQTAEAQVEIVNQGTTDNPNFVRTTTTITENITRTLDYTNKQSFYSFGMGGGYEFSVGQKARLAFDAEAFYLHARSIRGRWLNSDGGIIDPARGIPEPWNTYEGIQYSIGGSFMHPIVNQFNIRAGLRLGNPIKFLDHEAFEQTYVPVQFQLGFVYMP